MLGPEVINKKKLRLKEHEVTVRAWSNLPKRARIFVRLNCR